MVASVCSLQGCSVRFVCAAILCRQLATPPILHRVSACIEPRFLFTESTTLQNIPQHNGFSDCRALAVLKGTRRVPKAPRATKALVLEALARQGTHHHLNQVLVPAPTPSQATLDLGLATSLVHVPATSLALALGHPTSTMQDRHWQTRV